MGRDGKGPHGSNFYQPPPVEKGLGANISPVQGQTTQAKKWPNVWTAVGSWRDFVVDWCPGAVATTPSAEAKRKSPCHHKCLLQTLGQPLQRLPPRASEPPLAAASESSSPHRSISSMTISTFHLDLSPQSDSSEVSVSAEAQKVMVPVRGEKVFKQGK